MGTWLVFVVNFILIQECEILVRIGGFSVHVVELDELQSVTVSNYNPSAQPKVLVNV